MKKILKDITFNRFLIIILVIWAVTATGACLYLWKMNQLLLFAAMTSRDFARNTNEAYKTLGECVADYEKCNPQEVKSQLLEFQQKNDNTWSQLQKYDSQLSKYHLKKQ